MTKHNTLNLCEAYSAEDNNSGARIANAIEDERTEESTFSIFPNPNTGSFKVELPVSETELTVEIVNTVGVTVKQMQHKSVEGNTELMVNDLTQGLYFVIVKQNGVLIGTKRVIVTK